MKRKSWFSHKVIWPFIIAGTFMLAACAGNEAEDGTAVTINKDGKIRYRIVSSFDKSYYDEDELQQRILREVASYNQTGGTDHVTVEKIEVKDNVAIVEMTYVEAADYAAFNGDIFFIGNAFKAQAEGYDLNKVLSGVENSMETVGMSDILAMTDYTLLITDIKDSVSLSGKAAYISDNVTVSRNLKTVSFDEESEELAYILYK